MIKPTIYFGNPANLYPDNKQLIIKLPQVEKNDTLTENINKNRLSVLRVKISGWVFCAFSNHLKSFFRFKKTRKKSILLG